MNHEELIARLARIAPDPGFVSYMFTWADNGQPAATLVSLIPHDDGTVTATEGDLRTRAEAVTDDSGGVRIFPNEATACDWAWEQLRHVGAPAPTYSAEQNARAAASREEQLRRAGEALRKAKEAR